VTDILFFMIIFLVLAIVLAGFTSLRKRDEHSKKNPYDDANLPPNNDGNDNPF
jgi:preprotein translocase subunit SecG